MNGKLLVATENFNKIYTEIKIKELEKEWPETGGDETHKLYARESTYLLNLIAKLFKNNLRKYLPATYQKKD
jgi:hypothetical protein